MRITRSEFLRMGAAAGAAPPTAWGAVAVSGAAAKEGLAASFAEADAPLPELPS